MNADRPNIVIIYADDLGFGDIGCYGASDIATPNLDKFAAEGLRFKQGYATAATCTPSRYSLLTGSYPWRNEQARILDGASPLIIPPDSTTLMSMLKDAEYATGMSGKWHLGLGKGDLDWNHPISATPLDVGFDEAFIMAATNDRVPCVYIEGRKVVNLDAGDPIAVSYANANPFPGLPTGRNNPELLQMKHSHGHDMSIVNGIGRIGYQRGGGAALWKDEAMAEAFLAQALAFIDRHQQHPFFLYYALHQPHVPRVPGPRFAGRTRLGPRGDVIAEMDWCVGELLKDLDRRGLARNTLVIFSSDNGPVLDDGYQDRAVELCGQHRPAGPLRGGKYSLYEGGVRTPFIVRWPGGVAPGTSSAVICQVDLVASLAALVGAALPAAAAPDSLNILPALLGQSNRGRRELVTEGLQAHTVLRQDDWIFIPPHAGPAFFTQVGIETGNALEPQLYHLAADVGQTGNLAGARREIADRMAARLREIRAGERTRPTS